MKVLNGRPAWARDGSALSARCENGDWHKAETALRDAAQGRPILEIAHVSANRADVVYARLG